ncbi:hypothetical protein [Vibrio tapetis]|uniref:Uncharacterized protein n=1 Tax=Vibrio tapetis subsp. tapetis TaxID=1671868 RepID=A0A2N8ZHW1_9VIBR|nr:hypothetical protein [Vibrio tapetis]SON51502.1 conserved exported protein of unknown function [Vibrio tapetis subsp. tapetis]
MRKKMLVLALTLNLVTPVGHSGGFPVIDVANITQMMTQYSTQLKEYSQLLKQTGLDTNQLLTAVEQYEQTLREYQVFLNQVESLKNKIDRRDYLGIERDIRSLNDLMGVNPPAKSNDYASARYGDLPQKETFETLAKESSGEVSNTLAQQYRNASDVHVRGEQLEHFRNRNENLRRNAAQLDNERLALGDQSELATLQLLVEQNQVLIDQNNLQADVKLATYAQSNPLQSQQALAVLEAQERRLKRMKAAREREIDVNETPIR